MLMACSGSNKENLRGVCASCLASLQMLFLRGNSFPPHFRSMGGRSCHWCNVSVLHILFCKMGVSQCLTQDDGRIHGIMYPSCVAQANKWQVLIFLPNSQGTSMLSNSGSPFCPIGLSSGFKVIFKSFPGLAFYYLSLCLSFYRQRN